MNFLHYIPESSSVIKLLVYDVNEQILAVEFHTGSIWIYHDVPLECIDELTSAKSIGQYFNLHIRNSYISQKAVTNSKYGKQLGIVFEKEK